MAQRKFSTQESLSFKIYLLCSCLLCLCRILIFYWALFLEFWITRIIASKLLASITLAEVKEAVFLLDANSALGPDWFSGRFYHSCWDIIATHLLSAVQEFIARVPFPRSVASTSIVLLLRKESLVTFADFRPINLCNFVNKVHTNTLFAVEECDAKAGFG